MFTGLVEEVGTVLSLVRGRDFSRLRVRAKAVLKGLRVGDSLAVNGCCLTVAARARQVLAFDLLEETLRCTNLGDLRAGDGVNLERSLRADSRVGGHFVSGHIDCAGTVKACERRGKNTWLAVAFPRKFRRYVIPKGSIGIDGVSLTVAEVRAASLGVWLIPHTLKVTRLGRLRTGARVNLEFDLLAKYAEQLAAK